MQKLLKRPRGYKREKNFKYKIVNELPEILKDRVIYIQSNLEYHWQMVMLCPCGCKNLLHMNLMSDYQPYWKYEIDKKDAITVYPSVHRIIGCESHFFIRKGKIIWCK